MCLRCVKPVAGSRRDRRRKTAQVGHAPQRLQQVGKQFICMLSCLWCPLAGHRYIVRCKAESDTGQGLAETEHTRQRVFRTDSPTNVQAAEEAVCLSEAKRHWVYNSLWVHHQRVAKVDRGENYFREVCWRTFKLYAICWAGLSCTGNSGCCWGFFFLLFEYMNAGCDSLMTALDSAYCYIVFLDHSTFEPFLRFIIMVPAAEGQ